MANHPDKKDLEIATREAIRFDLESIFGTFWSEIETNWESVEPKWVKLRDGSIYNCNGREKRSYGIMDALCYFTYARYLMINGYNDTPNGTVTKTNPFSVPKPLKEVQVFSTKYRNMAYEILENVKEYLCVNEETLFPNYNRLDCESCGCVEKESAYGDRNTGLGMRGKNIGKWDV